MPPEYGFYAVIGALVVYAAGGHQPAPGGRARAGDGDPGRDGRRGHRRRRPRAVRRAHGGARAGGRRRSACWARPLRLGFIASVLSKPVLVGYITGVGLTLLSSQIAGLHRAWRSRPATSSRGSRAGPRVRRGRPGDPRGRRWARWRSCWPCAAGPRRAGRPRGRRRGDAVVWLVSPRGRRWSRWSAPSPRASRRPGCPRSSLDDLADLLPVAAGIALVGFTDNVLTARSVADRHGYRIDPNQELLALGLTNLTSGLSQGFPVSSSASRTAVPASLGAGPSWSSLVAAALVVATPWCCWPGARRDSPGRPGRGHRRRRAGDHRRPRVPGPVAVSRQEAAPGRWPPLGVIVLRRADGGAASRSRCRSWSPWAASPGPTTRSWATSRVWTAGWRSTPTRTRSPSRACWSTASTRRCSSSTPTASAAGCRRCWWTNPGERGVAGARLRGHRRRWTRPPSTHSAELLEEPTGLGIGVVAVARANDAVVTRLRRAGLLEPSGPVRNFATINAAVRAFRQRSDTPSSSG